MQEFWRVGAGLENLVAVMVEEGRFGGAKRRTWKRRWRAPEVGKLGGAPPKYDADQAQLVRKIHAEYPAWKAPQIASVVAKTIGKPLSPKQVRGILKAS
jgi:transposase